MIFWGVETIIGDGKINNSLILLFLLIKQRNRVKLFWMNHKVQIGIIVQSGQRFYDNDWDLRF